MGTLLTYKQLIIIFEVLLYLRYPLTIAPVGYSDGNRIFFHLLIFLLGSPLPTILPHDFNSHPSHCQSVPKYYHSLFLCHDRHVAVTSETNSLL